MGAVHLWSLGVHALGSHLDLERALGLGPVPLWAMGVRAPRVVLDSRRDLGTGVGVFRDRAHVGGLEPARIPQPTGLRVQLVLRRLRQWLLPARRLQPPPRRLA